jgi:hypothetical protein
MHGRAGYSFAKSAGKYPEDVEVAGLRGQFVNEQLDGFLDCPSDVHRLVIEHYMI